MKKLLIPFIHFGNKVMDRVIFMLLFAFLFSAIGFIIPRIYFTYFDHTKYYEVKIPMNVGKTTYHPCELVDVTTVRHSYVTVNAEAVIELRLYRKDGKSKDIVDKQYRSLVIMKSNDNDTNILYTHWPLPCHIGEGRYLFEGIVYYKVNGIEKQTILRTVDFNVKVASSGADLEK